MEITDIRIRKLTLEDKMKAVISVTFDNELAVHDIKVIEGKEKLFIAMPNKKTSSGEFKDIVHPITSSMRDMLEKAIMEEYKKAIEQSETPAG